MSITFLSLKKRLDPQESSRLFSDHVSNLFSVKKDFLGSLCFERKKKGKKTNKRFVGAIVSSFLPSKSHLHTKLLVELSA